MFKVSIWVTNEMWEMWSELRKKIPERRVWCRCSVFMLNFEQLVSIFQLCFVDFELAIVQSLQNKDFFPIWLYVRNP